MYFMIKRRQGRSIAVMLVSLMTMFSFVGTLAISNPGFETVRFLFETNYRQNVVTWFSAIILLSIALLLSIIAWDARQEKRQSPLYWLGLTLLVMALSIDAVADIYGRAVAKQSNFDETGLFLYGWIFPVIILIILGIIAYLPFLKNLPKGFGRRLLTALLILLIGTIATACMNKLYLQTNLNLELSTTPQIVESVGAGTLRSYITLITLTQLIEWIGAILLIDVLLHYLKTHTNIHIIFDPNPTSDIT